MGSFGVPFPNMTPDQLDRIRKTAKGNRTATMADSTTTTPTQSTIEWSSNKHRGSNEIKPESNNRPWLSVDDFKKSYNRTAIIRRPADMPPPVGDRWPDKSYNPFPDSVFRFAGITRFTTTKAPITTQHPNSYSSPSIGTRTLIPALVSFVALLSLAMILVAVCRVVFNQCSRKKRLNDRQVEDGCKPSSTHLPSAPPPDDVSRTNVRVRLPEPLLSSTIPAPPDYETLFGSAAQENHLVNEKLVTSSDSRYPTNQSDTKECENSVPLLKPQSRYDYTVKDGHDLRQTDL